MNTHPFPTPPAPRDSGAGGNPPQKLRVGDRVRVKPDGYLTGKVGVVIEAPIEPDPNRPILETAWATVRFDGEIPATWRCDPEILEAA